MPYHPALGPKRKQSSPSLCRNNQYEIISRLTGFARMNECNGNRIGRSSGTYRRGAKLYNAATALVGGAQVNDAPII